MIKYTIEDREILYLENINLYSQHHEIYDKEYVEDINKFLHKHDYITEKQLDVLKRIYRSHEINKFIEGLLGQNSLESAD